MRACVPEPRDSGREHLQKVHLRQWGLQPGEGACHVPIASSHRTGPDYLRGIVATRIVQEPTANATATATIAGAAICGVRCTDIAALPIATAWRARSVFTVDATAATSPDVCRLPLDHFGLDGAASCSRQRSPATLCAVLWYGRRVFREALEYGPPWNEHHRHWPAASRVVLLLRRHVANTRLGPSQRSFGRNDRRQLPGAQLRG